MGDVHRLVLGLFLDRARLDENVLCWLARVNGRAVRWRRARFAAAMVDGRAPRMLEKDYDPG